MKISQAKNLETTRYFIHDGLNTEVVDLSLPNAENLRTLRRVGMKFGTTFHSQRGLVEFWVAVGDGGNETMAYVSCPGITLVQVLGMCDYFDFPLEWVDYKRYEK